LTWNVGLKLPLPRARTLRRARDRARGHTNCATFDQFMVIGREIHAEILTPIPVIDAIADEYEVKGWQLRNVLRITSGQESYD
jgi:hypothetical protein